MSTEQKEQILILLKTSESIPREQLDIIEELIDEIADLKSEDDLDLDILAAWVIYCWKEIAS